MTEEQFCKKVEMGRNIEIEKEQRGNELAYPPI